MNNFEQSGFSFFRFWSEYNTCNEDLDFFVFWFVRIARLGIVNYSLHFRSPLAIACVLIIFPALNMSTIQRKLITVHNLQFNVTELYVRFCGHEIIFSNLNIFAFLRTLFHTLKMQNKQVYAFLQIVYLFWCVIIIEHLFL